MRSEEPFWQRGSCSTGARVHVCVEEESRFSRCHTGQTPDLLRGQNYPAPAAWAPPSTPLPTSVGTAWVTSDPRPQESHGSVPEDDRMNGEAHSPLFQGSDEGPWGGCPTSLAPWLHSVPCLLLPFPSVPGTRPCLLPQPMMRTGYFNAIA